MVGFLIDIQMTEEKFILDKIISKYPLVFKDMEESTFSFLPEGWFDIVDAACSKIEPILEECYKQYPPGEQNVGAFRVEQIKEKFGSLRFYYTFTTEDTKSFEAIQDIVDKVEVDSSEICQITGKPGQICNKGTWFMTISEEARQLPEYKDYVVYKKDEHR